MADVAYDDKDLVKLIAQMKAAPKDVRLSIQKSMRTAANPIRDEAKRIIAPHSESVARSIVIRKGSTGIHIRAGGAAGATFSGAKWGDGVGRPNKPLGALARMHELEGVGGANPKAKGYWSHPVFGSGRAKDTASSGVKRSDGKPMWAKQHAVAFMNPAARKKTPEAAEQMGKVVRDGLAALDLKPSS